MNYAVEKGYYYRLRGYHYASKNGKAENLGSAVPTASTSAKHHPIPIAYDPFGFSRSYPIQMKKVRKNQAMNPAKPNS